MLLDGSYLRDVEKVLDAFKVVRRRQMREGFRLVWTSVAARWT
jgi:hypothetical protein